MSSQSQQPERRPMTSPVTLPGDGSGTTGYSIPVDTRHPAPQNPWPETPARVAPPQSARSAGDPGDTTQIPPYDPTQTGLHSSTGYETPAAGFPAVTDGPESTPPSNNRRRPLTTSRANSSGGPVPDTSDTAASTTSRERSESSRPTPFLWRGLPKPLATLGQLGGLAAIPYLLWGVLAKVVSFVGEHPKGVAITVVIIALVACAGQLVKMYLKQVAERREEEEDRATLRRQKLRDRGFSDEEIDDLEGPARTSRRSGAARRATSRPGSHR